MPGIVCTDEDVFDVFASVGFCMYLIMAKFLSVNSEFTRYSQLLNIDMYHFIFFPSYFLGKEKFMALCYSVRNSFVLVQFE